MTWEYLEDLSGAFRRDLTSLPMERVILVAPYLKGEALEDLLSLPAPPERPIRLDVLTRVSLQDWLSGHSDLAALEWLMEEAPQQGYDVRIYACRNIQARFLLLHPYQEPPRRLETPIDFRVGYFSSPDLTTGGIGGDIGIRLRFVEKPPEPEEPAEAEPEAEQAEEKTEQEALPSEEEAVQEPVPVSIEQEFVSFLTRRFDEWIRQLSLRLLIPRDLETMRAQFDRYYDRYREFEDFFFELEEDKLEALGGEVEVRPTPKRSKYATIAPLPVEELERKIRLYFGQHRDRFEKNRMVRALAHRRLREMLEPLREAIGEDGSLSEELKDSFDEHYIGMGDLESILTKEPEEVRALVEAGDLLPGNYSWTTIWRQADRFMKQADFWINLRNLLSKLDHPSLEAVLPRMVEKVSALGFATLIPLVLVATKGGFPGFSDALLEGLRTLGIDLPPYRVDTFMVNFEHMRRLQEEIRRRLPEPYQDFDGVDLFLSELTQVELTEEEPAPEEEKAAPAEAKEGEGEEVAEPSEAAVEATDEEASGETPEQPDEPAPEPPAPPAESPEEEEDATRIVPPSEED